MRLAVRTGLVASAIAMSISLLSISLSQAQDENEVAAPLLIAECKQQLPENKLYTINIGMTIDTGDGEQSNMELMLVDNAAPSSVDIPAGTEGFIFCVLESLGIPEAEI